MERLLWKSVVKIFSNTFPGGFSPERYGPQPGGSGLKVFTSRGIRISFDDFREPSGSGRSDPRRGLARDVIPEVPTVRFCSGRRRTTLGSTGYDPYEFPGPEGPATASNRRFPSGSYSRSGHRCKRTRAESLSALLELLHTLTHRIWSFLLFVEVYKITSFLI